MVQFKTVNASFFVNGYSKTSQAVHISGMYRFVWERKIKEQRRTEHFFHGKNYGLGEFLRNAKPGTKWTGNVLVSPSGIVQGFASPPRQFQSFEPYMPEAGSARVVLVALLVLLAVLLAWKFGAFK